MPFISLASLTHGRVTAQPKPARQMGAQPTKPEREEADELRKNVPQACSAAADAILEADVLLATGAGWSATWA